MKSIKIVLCICFVSVNLFAQKIKPLEQQASQGKINELGLAFNADLYRNATGGEGVDILYKHFFKSWQCFRVNLGYQHTYENLKNTYFAYDTNKLARLEKNLNVNYLKFGFGIEAQRHFYKNLYLFAAVDVQAMIGKGKTEEFTTIYRDATSTKIDSTVFNSSSFKPTNNSQFFITPSIGAKFNFKKMSFGVEVFNGFIGFKQSHSADKQADISIFDFDLGSNAMRIFACYRF